MKDSEFYSIRYYLLMKCHIHYILCETLDNGSYVNLSCILLFLNLKCMSSARMTSVYEF